MAGIVLSKIKSFLTLLQIRGAFLSFIRWPLFSLASFTIVNRLIYEGVRPKTVIDVGANVGQFAICASRLFRPELMVSIEPDRDVARRLRKNLKAEKSIEIFETAIGDYDGEIQFHINKDSQVSSILNLGEVRVSEFPDSVVKDTISVPIATLDSLFARRKLAQPILVKIDVQGTEDRVLTGGLNFLKQVEWILIEVSFADLYDGELGFRQILSILDRYEYELVGPVNFHISPTMHKIIEMDVLFRRKSS